MATIESEHSEKPEKLDAPTELVQLATADITGRELLQRFSKLAQEEGWTSNETKSSFLCYRNVLSI